MSQDKDKSQNEPEMAVALASFLLNVLILLLLCGSAWMLHTFVAQPDSSYTFLRGFTTHR
jgi:hypothetical protein